MKNINTFLQIIFLFIIFSQTPIKAQDTCYVRLDEASGVNTDDVFTMLDTTACKIRDLLPTDYQDQFAVYDFGFYVFHEVYENGYPRAFALMQDQVEAQTPYYLLIGKESDHTGVFKKFWIDLKLPLDAGIDCLTPQIETTAKSLVSIAVENKYAQYDNSYSFFAEAEVAGMEEMESYLDWLINCCERKKVL